MPSFPSFPRFDLSDFDLSKIDLPKFELPKLDMPDLPDVDLPSAEQVAGFARDAAYVGVGLAVITAERLQALQQQVLDVLKEQLAKVRAAV